MKTLIKSEAKLENLFNRDSTASIREKTNSYINVLDSKFYQKLFMVFMAVSIFLIFPDSPNELEKVCMSYNSKKVCNVW